MGIDQVVVFCIILVIGLFFFVFMMDYVVPVYLKIEFDSICRDYVLLIEAQSGLEADQKEALKQSLLQRNIVIDEIQCSEPKKIKKGEWITFNVKASLKRMVLKDLFSREEVVYHFDFIQNVVSSKAIN